ncbi:alpha/beta fold hydrolase [Nocardia africana]|uniref:Alpha/beta fold hydrolase n=1 Tax=Nocardia africana TaxID=134964 RepID=A0ABW6NK36_9NOCA
MGAVLGDHHLGDLENPVAVSARVRPPAWRALLAFRCSAHTHHHKQSGSGRTRADGDLFCKLRGHGLILLLLPGGAGDVGTYDRPADHLATSFRVLTYDRRGQSRSTTPSEDVTIGTHAGDAAAVLAAVTSDPALVFGSSIGAVIAVELVLTHPGAVSRAVVHEPPISALLPARSATPAMVIA